MLLINNYQKELIITVLISVLFQYILSVQSLPERCCTTDQWQAEIHNAEVNNKADLRKFNWQRNLFYDYRNQQWAYEEINPQNTSEFTKLVFDHKHKTKYFITSKYCHAAKLNVDMYKYCVPDNSTYLGTIVSGNITSNIWSWDLSLFPIRGIIKLSNKHCLPLQEASYNLVANSFILTEGNPSCIPWQEPFKTSNGLCYKSFTMTQKRQRSSEITAHMTNAEFVNFRPHIDQSAFTTPYGCIFADEWPAELKLSRLQRFFIMRFKWDYEFLKRLYSKNGGK